MDKCVACIALAASIAALPGSNAEALEGAAPATVTRIELEHSDLPGTNLETRLYLIVYPPHTVAPVHHHPVEGIGYIVKGTARSAFGSDAPITLVAGQSFHDKADITHTIYENADAHRPLKFVVAYTVQKGTPVLEMP